MKEKKIKSAIPIYGCAALWLILGLLLPKMLLKPWFLIVAALITAAVYMVLGKLFPGRVVQVRESANSGNRDVDAMIEEGRKRLENLQLANDHIPDEKISACLARMVKSGDEIFRVLEKDTAQAHSVRRFMNYYLPTTEKLMDSYRMMMQSKNPGENIAQAMQSVENSLGMIADAFDKQLDNLYSDRKLDIETDIEVLETMMTGDGLVERDSIQKNTAAQAGN